MAKRILFVSTNRIFGGSEVLWLRVARMCLAEGYSVGIYMFKWSTYPSQFQDIFSDKRVIIYYNVNPDFFTVLFRRLFERFYQPKEKWYGFNPDLVLLSLGNHLKISHIPNLCVKRGIPYALIFQLVSEKSVEGNFDYKRAILGSLSVYFASEQNKKLLQHQLADNIPQGKVIYNPMPVGNAISFSWPFNSEDFSFAVVSRLDAYHKGLDVLFEVLAMKKWRERNLYLNIYGQGGSKAYLESLADYYGLRNIYFRGHAEDILSVWQSNCCLLLPSRHEGMSLALIEAMLHGRVCVTTDVGGASELIESGKSGFIASASVQVCFDTALEAAWQARHNWKEIGRAAYNRVRDVISIPPEKKIFGDIQEFLSNGSF